MEQALVIVTRFKNVETDEWIKFWFEDPSSEFRDETSYSDCSEKSLVILIRGERFYSPENGLDTKCIVEKCIEMLNGYDVSKLGVLYHLMNDKVYVADFLRLFRAKGIDPEWIENYSSTMGDFVNMQNLDDNKPLNQLMHANTPFDEDYIDEAMNGIFAFFNKNGIHESKLNLLHHYSSLESVKSIQQIPMELSEYTQKIQEFKNKVCHCENELDDLYVQEFKKLQKELGF